MVMQATLPFDITARKHGGNPESRAANLAISASKEVVRKRVLEFAAGRGERGITADEVAEAFHCTHNHVAPRISELRTMGLLLPSDHRRATRSGCTARVLVAARRG